MQINPRHLYAADRRFTFDFDQDAGAEVGTSLDLAQSKKPQAVAPTPATAAPSALPDIPEPAQPVTIARRAQSSMAPTLFQGGMTPRPFEIQPPQRPAKSSADKIRETVANQIRYEDLAPKMEEVPRAPGFVPKAKYGWKDKLKMAIGGAGLGNQRGGGLGAIGGIIAGLINPEGVDRAGYAAYAKPQYDAQTQTAMGRNKAKLDAFTQEVKNREVISKINQETRGKYQQMTGGAQLMMYNDATGKYYPVTVDGEPVEHPSIAVGRGHDTTQKFLEKFKAKETTKRDETRHGYKLEEIDVQGAIRKAIADAANREAMKRLGITEGGKNRRQRTQLQAEGYDLGEGTGTGAGTGSARPGGGGGKGTTENPANPLERLRRFEDENEERDDWWP